MADGRSGHDENGGDVGVERNDGGQEHADEGRRKSGAVQGVVKVMLCGASGLAAASRNVAGWSVTLYVVSGRRNEEREREMDEKGIVAGMVVVLVDGVPVRWVKPEKVSVGGDEGVEAMSSENEMVRVALEAVNE